MIFLLIEEVLEAHARVIDETGGSHGIIDINRLLSALAAPQNRYHYEAGDLAACAATYAYHIAQAHAFVDGNKRTAEAATMTFIYANAAELEVTEDELVELFLGIGSGQVTRLQAEQFLRRRIVPSE